MAILLSLLFSGLCSLGQGGMVGFLVGLTLTLPLFVAAAWSKTGSSYEDPTSDRRCDPGDWQGDN